MCKVDGFLPVVEYNFLALVKSLPRFQKYLIYLPQPLDQLPIKTNCRNNNTTLEFITISCVFSFCKILIVFDLLNLNFELNFRVGNFFNVTDLVLQQTKTSQMKRFVDTLSSTSYFSTIRLSKNSVPLLRRLYIPVM